MYARTNSCYNKRRLWAWNGLPLNTYISMYARTNKCYNERRLWAWNGLPLNTYISMYARTNRCYNERRLWAWNGLPLNTYISMYARTNRCYNERGSRTNYVRSSIPQGTVPRKHCLTSEIQNPNLRCNTHRRISFTWVSPWVMKLPTHSTLVASLRMSRSMPSLQHTPSWRSQVIRLQRSI